MDSKIRPGKVGSSGGTSSGGQYSSYIEKTATNKGLSPDVAKAVAMQESSMGKTSKNVMQVNGMDNASPQASIEKGVSMLSNYMKKYSLDWALAAYNMGEGIVNWSKKNGISDPKQAMYAFSNYQKQKNGYNVYGDPEYIDHVKRYL